MWVRLRLPELLDEHGISAYALARDSGGKLGEKTVYRLVRRRGEVRYLDAHMLQAIYKTLGLTSLDELLSPDPPPPRATRKRRKAA